MIHLTLLHPPLLAPSSGRLFPGFSNKSSSGSPAGCGVTLISKKSLPNDFDAPSKGGGVMLIGSKPIDTGYSTNYSVPGEIVSLVIGQYNPIHPTLCLALW